MCLIWLLLKYKNCMIVFNPSRKTIELMAQLELVPDKILTIVG